MRENYFASRAVAQVLRKTLHRDIKEALQLSLAITVLWGNFRPKLQHQFVKKRPAGLTSSRQDKFDFHDLH